MAKYCVIGQNTYNRTWFVDRDGAVDHAKALVREPGQRPGTELLVVVVVARVKLANPTPPIEVTYE